MSKYDDTPKIPIQDCIRGRVYRIHSRNLGFGVYDGKEGFIGIREKFGERFLFTEYHWDQGPPFGTVYGQVDLGIDLPEDIPLLLSLGTVDEITGRPVEFDKSPAQGGRGWFFINTNETSEAIRPRQVPNNALFQFLDAIEKEHR